MNQEPDKCSICYESFECKNISISDCNHKFHFKCLQKWMIQSNKCPLCRNVLFETEQAELHDLIQYQTRNDEYLLRCAEYGNFEGLLIGLRHGDTNRYRHLLRKSVEYGHLHIVKRLIDFDGMEPSCELIKIGLQKGHTEIVKFLINEEANYDYALYLAVKYRNFKIVKYALNYGANIDRLPQNMKTNVKTLMSILH